MSAFRRAPIALALAAAAALPAAAQQPRADLHGDPLPAGAVARIGTTRLRHVGEIERVALSTDGKLLVTATDRRPLRVWDADTGALVREVPCATEPSPVPGHRPQPLAVAAMAFPADATRLLYVLTASGTLRECDVSDGTWSEPLARTPEPDNGLSPHAYGLLSPDRTHFLYLPMFSPAPRVEVFAAGRDKPLLRVFGRPTPPAVVVAASAAAGSAGVSPWALSAAHRTAAISADNRLLAVPAERGRVQVWDIRAERVQATYAGPDGFLHSLAFAPDGKSLAAVFGPMERAFYPGTPQSFLLAWDTATGKEKFRTPNCEGTNPTYIPDGSKLLTFARNEVLVADPATGRLASRLRGHGAWAIWGHSFSPDGERMATCGRDHTAIIWDLAAGKPALDFDSPRGPVTVLAFSPDGKTLFTACDEDHTGGLWDAATGRLIRRLVIDGKGDPRAAAFTPDGRHVAVGYGTRGTSTGSSWPARLWSVADGKIVREFGGHTDGAQQLAVSPDGRRLATWDWGGKVRLWDLGTGALLKEADAAGSAGYQRHGQLAFRPSGEAVFGLNDRKTGFRVVELATGKVLVERAEKDRPGLLRLSADGRLGVFVRSDRGRPFDLTLTVRDIDTDEVRLSLPLNDFSTSSDVVSLSPDGRTLAIGRGRHGGVEVNRTVHLYDVATGKPTRTLSGHGGWVCGLAFSPGGERLATGGWDSTALVWDLGERP